MAHAVAGGRAATQLAASCASIPEAGSGGKLCHVDNSCAIRRLPAITCGDGAAKFAARDQRVNDVPAPPECDGWLSTWFEPAHCKKGARANVGFVQFLAACY